jgi:ribonuclease BN (tRNA processing enzyme)
VWLDAGNGTFARLTEYISFRDVDAVVLTHGHADHSADMVPLLYALGFDSQTPPATMPVYAPGDVESSLKWPLGDTSLEMFKRVFKFTSIVPRFDVGAINFESFRTHHPAETYGLRLSEDGGVVVYTSDTAYFPELASSCREADVLIAEATYVEGVNANPGVHMWAREAGRLAAEANAKRLVLTHIWTTIDPDQAVKEAAAEFSGPVEAAVEGTLYTV